MVNFKGQNVAPADQTYRIDPNPNGLPYLHITGPGSFKLWPHKIYGQYYHYVMPGTPLFAELTELRNGKVEPRSRYDRMKFHPGFKQKMLRVRCKATDFDVNDKPMKKETCPLCVGLYDYIYQIFEHFKEKEEKEVEILRVKIKNEDKKYDAKDTASQIKELGTGRRMVIIPGHGNGYGEKGKDECWYNGRKIGGWFDVKAYYPRLEYEMLVLIEDKVNDMIQGPCRFEPAVHQVKAILGAYPEIQDYLKLHGTLNTIKDKRPSFLEAPITVAPETLQTGNKKMVFVVGPVTVAGEKFFLDHGFHAPGTGAVRASKDFVRGASDVKAEVPPWALYVLRLSGGKYEDINTTGHVLSVGIKKNESIDGWIFELVGYVAEVAKTANNGILVDYAATAQAKQAELVEYAKRFVEDIPEADREDKKYTDCDRRLRVPQLLK